MRTNAVRALADVVATKLNIIFLSSMHILFSQKGFAYNCKSGTRYAQPPATPHPHPYDSGLIFVGKSSGVVDLQTSSR